MVNNSDALLPCFWGMVARGSRLAVDGEVAVLVFGLDGEEGTSVATLEEELALVQLSDLPHPGKVKLITPFCVDCIVALDHDGVSVLALSENWFGDVVL